MMGSAPYYFALFSDFSYIRFQYAQRTLRRVGNVYAKEQTCNTTTTVKPGLYDVSHRALSREDS